MTYIQTTYFPNILVDTHLPYLTESEIKIILVIIRQTNGWIDKRTGLRKTRDRISHGQFMRKTGLCRRVISKTLKSLVQKDLVSITDQYGNLLREPCKRKGVTRMFYSFQSVPVKPRPTRVCGVPSIGDILRYRSQVQL